MLEYDDKEEEYLSFIKKTTGAPVKIVIIREVLDLMAKMPSYELKFFSGKACVWIIPLETITG